MSDFIKAFIKFHGHVYLTRSVEQLDALRQKLEEQFQVGSPQVTSVFTVFDFFSYCFLRLQTL